MPRVNPNLASLHKCQLLSGGFHGDAARLDEVIVILQ